MDPNVGAVDTFYAHPGLLVRLTRNLDKERGYVNGAVGTVRKILSWHGEKPIIFTVKLLNGVYVLVHPIWDKKQCFLPCTYGYATTVRRAQGATYEHGCLFFDHVHPAMPGYGYAGVSRFRRKSGIYLFGKIRRTDWIPVRHDGLDDDVQYYRGEFSDDDYDSEAAYPEADDGANHGERTCSDDYQSDQSDSDSNCSRTSFLDYDDMESYIARKRSDHDFDHNYLGNASANNIVNHFVGTPIVDESHLLENLVD